MCIIILTQIHKYIYYIYIYIYIYYDYIYNNIIHLYVIRYSNCTCIILILLLLSVYFFLYLTNNWFLTRIDLIIESHNQGLIIFVIYICELNLDSCLTHLPTSSTLGPDVDLLVSVIDLVTCIVTHSSQGSSLSR